MRLVLAGSVRSVAAACDQRERWTAGGVAEGGRAARLIFAPCLAFAVGGVRLCGGRAVRGLWAVLGGLAWVLWLLRLRSACGCVAVA